MNTKKLLLLGVLAAVAAGLAGRLIRPHPATTTVALQQNIPAPAAPIIPAAPAPVMPPAPEPAVIEPAPITVAQAAIALDIQPVKKAKKNGSPAKTKPPIQDPDARIALSFVGADPEAEDYWISAINNPQLPAEERKDLIEDLNEDGLSDPHHPGPQDMPLILNRIALINQLQQGPTASDPVNADALAEAKKDLVNLASGQPAD